MTLWHEPIGVDFSDALVRGLRARMEGTPPEAMAAVTVFLPMERMRRRVREMFLAGGAAVLPRLLLVSDVSPLLPHLALPSERSGLAVQLELARLVDALLAARPEIGPRGAAFDLAGTLGTLLQEMKEEGVRAAALERIDATGLAEHWQNNLGFLRIAAEMAEDAERGTAADVQGKCLAALEALWRDRPPEGLTIVAGSTGSRAPTLRLMRMVHALPGGHVVLPGLDTEMPPAQWNALAADGRGVEDHPQFRHHAVLRALDLAPETVAQWSDLVPASPARNALVSLALRPPPVTDAWLEEGPGLAPRVGEACAGLTLLEAPTQGEEADTIALRLRGAVEEGRRAALISPDRTLSRMVSAALLDRWGIVADDSAGFPLDLSPPGRLLIQVARMRGRPLDAEGLVALLKHPLVHSNGARREHLKRVRDMELGWLRGLARRPDGPGLRAWASRETTRGVLDAWTLWLSDLLLRLQDQSAMGDPSRHVAEHLDLMEDLAGGSELGEGDPLLRPTGDLWQNEAGRRALGVMRGLARDAEAAADLQLSAPDYARLLAALLAAENVVDPFKPHPGVMIWGALESRVQGADLVILGGLVDGVWPSLPGADMWVNRAMRAACGLRCPERTVGLSAHDFQQAVAGREVWLTRALRGPDARTVPSRWLNRITSLLGGIGEPGQDALADMRRRGERWRRRALALARADDRHRADPAPRPAPVPPPAARPRRLSVTQVETLIRDPYAVYARHVLGLRALDPLRPPTDAAMRGTVVHEALSRLDEIEMDENAEAALLDALRDEMARQVPGPGRRGLWQGRFQRIAAEFLAEERERRRQGRSVLQEEGGELPLPALGFTLTAKADRMDERDGRIAIFDYKTGRVPTEKATRHFDKQLFLEAVMVAEGAFPTLGRREVSEVSYLGLGGTVKSTRIEMTPEILAETRTGLERLIERYLADGAFVSRLAHEALSYASPYDQLARHGEWDDTVPARAIPVGAPR